MLNKFYGIKHFSYLIKLFLLTLHKYIAAKLSDMNSTVTGLCLLLLPGKNFTCYCHLRYGATMPQLHL